MPTITIPAGVPEYRWGSTTFGRFCEWLWANGIPPQAVDGSQPMTVTDREIGFTTKQGPALVQVSMQMHPELATALTNLFPPEAPAYDAETASLDDLSQLYRQLKESRQIAADAKKAADEARDQILARLRETGREYGGVNGQRVVHAKTLEKSYFDKAAAERDNPGLTEKYTTKRPETRLEIL